jgi:hypothetical protein
MYPQKWRQYWRHNRNPVNQKEQNYYQGVIGVLRWICELGRLDILVPVSLLF